MMAHNEGYRRQSILRLLEQRASETCPLEESIIHFSGAEMTTLNAAAAVASTLIQETEKEKKRGGRKL
ncbi:MAG: hypothetical protein OEM29_08315 [Thermoplasmata archaeon]|nr:hypothetical protein [Thermoplasmata archaeon]